MPARMTPMPTARPLSTPAETCADLCADGAISAENILSLVRMPLIGPREHTASGWFGQTDFLLCQRHVDAAGDLRDDHVFITLWKRWDFYLSVQQVPLRRGLGGLPARLAATVAGRSMPTTAQLALGHRSYAGGQPGHWQALNPEHQPDAWQACQDAWHGLLAYLRQALGQHRARYPLYERLLAELTAERIEAFTSLPVFAQRCPDWWDSERNGWWEEDIWVGARQPCMHHGEPWGRALKFSWKNGTEAPGDAEDDAHGIYQIDVDEARTGPPVAAFSYAQRQSDSRTALPQWAAMQIAQLLDFYCRVEANVHALNQQVQEDPAMHATNTSR